MWLLVLRLLDNFLLWFYFRRIFSLFPLRAFVYSLCGGGRGLSTFCRLG